MLAMAISAEAEQRKKIPLIGYLSNSNRSETAARSEGVRFALRERGYIEGQNITIQYRYADGKIDRYEETMLVINLKTAKQIGLTIPPNVLARADRVIK